MEKKMVKIVLDKERNLYFNLNSLEIIEELTGKTIDKVTQNLNMKSLKAIVYAGLVHEDKSLTVEISVPLIRALGTLPDIPGLRTSSHNCSRLPALCIASFSNSLIVLYLPLR